MKICFISFEYPPFSWGGAGVYAKCLSTELAKLGHEIHVLTSHVYGSRTNSIENGVFVHRIPFLNTPFLSLPSYMLSLTKSYKWAEKNIGEFCVLHGNDISDFSLPKLLARIPRIVTIHHLAHISNTRCKVVNPAFVKKLWDLRGESGLPLSFFQKTVIKRADKIIACSKFTKRTILSIYHIPDTRVDVIHPAVYPEDYDLRNCDFMEDVEVNTRKKLGIEGVPIILFVGRLEARKNLPLLFKAYKLLLDKVKAKLVIVGSGPIDRYRTMARSLGIEEQIVFTGWIDDITLKILYSICDIFVLPSLLEGFGIVLLEAMAAGKPVVTTNVGAIPEVVKDPENGRLVDPHDPKEMSEALMYLLTDEKRAKHIGERNKNYVKKFFSWSYTAEKTERVYNSLIE